MFPAAWLLALGVGAPLGQAAAPLDLQLIAQSSPRPALCAAAQGRADARQGRWQRARVPVAASYCRELARGYAALTVDPSAALQHGQRAVQLRPDAAASILVARAHTALGAYALAWQSFARVGEQGLGADVGTLHDFALAARHAGDGAAAVKAYRRLMSRLDLFASRERRIRACVEAAFAVLDEGSSALEEARSLLERAQRLNDSTRLPRTLSLAVALLSEQKLDAVSAPSPEAWLLELKTAPEAPVLIALDREVLLAFAWEAWDAQEALEHWEQVLEAAASGSHWSTQARRRSDALR